jgi:hypothetical protein
MASTAGQALRWLRALVLAGVALATGVVAHVGAGGFLPGPVGLVTLWLLAAASVAPLLGRQASTTRVVVLVMTGQTIIHLVLTALVGHRGDEHGLRPVSSPVSPPVIPTSAGRRTGSFLDHVAPVPAGGGHAEWAVPYWVQHLAADMTGPHALMALAHLAAAAAVGWWLAAGERALWTLMTVTSRPLVEGFTFLFRSGLASTVAGIAASGGPRLGGRHYGWADPRPSCVVFLQGTLTRRGPPVLSAS